MMEIYQAALIAMEMMMQYTNVVRCAIWYHSYNLKNVKNTHGGMLILVKLQAEVGWHQIAQHTANYNYN